MRHEINVSKPIANKAQYLSRPLSICNGFYNLNAAEIFIKAQPVRYEFGCNYVLFNNLSQWSLYDANLKYTTRARTQQPAAEMWNLFSPHQVE